jgi:hypothetical protein
LPHKVWAGVPVAIESEQRSTNPSEVPNPPNNWTDCSQITTFAEWQFFLDGVDHSDFRWFGIKILSTVQFAFQNVRMNVSACEHADVEMHPLLPKTDICSVLSTRIPDEFV